MKTNGVTQEPLLENGIPNPWCSTRGDHSYVADMACRRHLGWFLLEQTVLRDSQAARDCVEFSSKIFPWLGNIKPVMQEAEKGLYLRSVYTVALAPNSVIAALVIALHSLDNDIPATQSTFKNFQTCCVAFGILTIGISGMYGGILQHSFGKLHRTDYSFVVGQVTVPCLLWTRYGHTQN